MRSRTRIKPILELIEQIWEMNPDLRLGQLLDNAGVNRYSEDVNKSIEQLCSRYNLPFRYYAMWGVRPNPSGEDVVYKKLETLTTPHLKNILKNAHPAKNIKEVIFELLEDRGEFEEEVEVEQYGTCIVADDGKPLFPEYAEETCPTCSLNNEYEYDEEDEDEAETYEVQWVYFNPSTKSDCQGRFCKSFDTTDDEGVGSFHIDSALIEELKEKLPSIEEYISKLKKSK